ncbi:protein kinase domain-containing protein [Streptomyces sp. NBC_00076]|uniref:protein kinase domain-containing protein n=1 Tax=Streptomyces sp. NBC_00076 TaxID=2975642 RepID=UPI0032467084
MSALEPDDPRSVGDYRIVSRLGAGGMGRVYLGRSPGGRLVAVKVVHAELLRRPEFRSRFRREVQAARLVSGAFTAPVIDADPDAPLPWLVTSYIAGPSLEQAVAEQGPLGARAVLALAAGLAEALVSIHSVSLVHRDLKPSNVLLAEDGPRVIDFGIVRSVEADSITRTGHMAGSPGFMAPEQVSGDEITPASDVFCLGAVLAFAATGGNPFGGGPTPALLYRVVHNEPDVGAVADPTLRALISACLAKDPARRPSPREILTRVGPTNGESTTALRRVGQWPPAVAPDPAGSFGTDPAAHTDMLPRNGHADPSVDPSPGPLPDAVDPRAASIPHQATVRGQMAHGQTAHPEPVHPEPAHPQPSYGQPPPSQPAHPQAAYPPTRVHPTRPTPYPTPHQDPTQPPPPGTPGGPSSGRGDREGRSRRAFLLSGVGAVAAVGVGAGIWLTRPAEDKSGDAERTGASPSPSARLAEPVAAWPLNETSGVLARDTAGGNDGTATGVRWLTGDGGGAEFDGTGSQIITDGPVLKTGAGRSFTVAAWVRLSAVPGFFATAVSQDTTKASGFYLQYSSAEKRWAFARPGTRAVGYTAPAADVWTHLVGVCDGPAGKLRLYVDGVQEAAVEDTEPIPAPGALVIGRATHDGQPSDFFPGAIRNVRVFDRALTSARVKTLK